MKSQVLHTVWCNISCEAAGEIWSLLGVRGLTYCFVNCLQGYYRRLDQLQDDFVSILEKAREVCRSDNEVGSREATFDTVRSSVLAGWFLSLGQPHSVYCTSCQARICHPTFRPINLVMFYVLCSSFISSTLIQLVWACVTCVGS